MTRYATKNCNCPDVITGTGGKRPDFCEPHGERFYTEKEAERSVGVGADPRQRSSLTARSAPDNRRVGVDSSTPQKPRRRKGLKPGKGLSASPEQQRKVHDLACINCGRDRFEVTITAMHVYPRRFAACDCADGVVPGCAECHDLYDDQLGGRKLDLLPLLVAHKLHRELVHPVVVHEAPIFHVLEIVTGTPWIPAIERSAAA